MAVEKDSPEGQALALDKDTWFYQGERGTFEIHDLSPGRGRPRVRWICWPT